MGEPRVLRAVTVIDTPYVMRKSSSNQSLVGNDQYEGYMIDLLYEIVKIVHFNFTIYEAPEVAHGFKDENGEWKGMVGEILRKNADFAAASLAITRERNEVRPEKKDPGFFTVLSPLSTEVWLCILTAFVVVALTFMMQSRISPDERKVFFNKTSSKPSSNGNSYTNHHRFSLRNSLWFTAGALMQQGTDIHPRALSTRMLAGVWWFFTIIIISCYTANLSAFLTVERMVSPIESVEDLAQQTKIKYGIPQYAEIRSVFKESKIPTFQKMWAFMQGSKPSVFVNNESEGIERVEQEDFALITDTLMIEYNIERDCSLMQIGGPISSKGLAMAFQIGSEYVQPVNDAILQLEESGILAELKYKWWTQNGGGQCQEKSNGKSGANPLSLPSVSGAFIILLLGLATCLTVSALERGYRTTCKNNAK